MNKAFISFCLISSLTLMTGCFKSDAPEPYLDTVVTKTFVGEIESLTSDLSDLDATHLMITESKNRVYLNSVLHDLDLYIDKQIRISGNYLEKQLNNKPVDLIFVNQIDVLEDLNKEVSTLETLPSFGISFDLSEQMQLQSNFPNLTISFLDDPSVLSLQLHPLSVEQDIDLFVANKYPDFSFDNLNIASNAYKFYRASDTQLLYLTQNQNVLYEMDLRLLTSESSVKQFDNFLVNLNYFTPTGQFLNSEVIEEANGIATELEFAPIAPDDNSSQQEVPAEEPVEEGLNFENKDIVEDFLSQVDNVVPTFSKAVSFAFTDNKHFYLIFIDNENKEARVLVNYTNGYLVKATFVEGVNTDWELSSGVNDVYDRPLTFINLRNDKIQVNSLPEGFRLFETPALGFSLSYPASWYYIRDEDSYLFALEPVTQDNVLIIVSPVGFESTNVAINSPLVEKMTRQLDDKSIEFKFDPKYKDFVQKMYDSIDLLEE